MIITEYSNKLSKTQLFYFFNMSNIKVDIDRFDGSGDYRIWRRKIRSLLAQQKLLRVLEDPIEWPDNTSKVQQEELLETATGIIIFNLSDAIIRLVDKEETPAKMWKKLEEQFQQKSLTNKIYLKERIFGFKMSHTKTLDQNLDEFLRMHIELANSGENEALSDENQAIIILNSLPESYREVKTAIKYGRTSITLEEVISALKSKDLEMKSEKTNSGNGEMNLSRGRSSHKKSFQNRGRSTSSNHHRSSNKGKSRSPSRDSGDTTGCFYCGKSGHYKRDCYFYNNKNKNKKGGRFPERTDQNKHQNDKQQEANYSDGYDSGEVYVASTSFKDDWILDSGCTFHMTNSREILTDYRDSKGGKVILGNNNTCSIEGSSKVSFKMFDGIVRTLTGVRYVPNLARNLISISVLDDMGIVSKIEAGSMKLSKGAMTIIKGHKHDGLYYLDGEPVTQCNNAVTSNPEDLNAILWHRRLGHISEKGLQIMSDQKLLGKDRVSKVDFCESCILGKHHRLKFKTGMHKTKHILEYVHSDLWGPEKTPTHGGNVYFMSIIDDHSRKVWVFLLKHC